MAEELESVKAHAAEVREHLAEMRSNVTQVSFFFFPQCFFFVDGGAKVLQVKQDLYSLTDTRTDRQTDSHTLSL